MPIDRTKEIQAEFDKGNYNLTQFDGAGVTETILKHPKVELTADKDITLYMLGLPYPKDPTKSKAVPMVNALQKLGGVQKFKRIYVSDKITFNGSFPNYPIEEMNQKMAEPLGLSRNIFDQITDDKYDVIEEFEWHAKCVNAAQACVSLSNVERAFVGGEYQNTGKVVGVSYTVADNPMTIYLKPKRVDNVNSFDFSAPGPLKGFKRVYIPRAVVSDMIGTNIFGRQKTAAYWNLEMRNCIFTAPSWPCAQRWSGFTVTEPMEASSFVDCTFIGFLRSGLEIRQSGDHYVKNLTVVNSIQDLLLQAPATVEGKRVSQNVWKSGHGTREYWQARIDEAKAEALMYGVSIAFPLL